MAERFAILALAGELASSCRHKLNGWSKGEATSSVAMCFQAWLRRRGGSGSANTDVLLSRIRAFFEAHGESRLEAYRTPQAGLPVRDRAGFKRFDEVGVTEYMVLPEAFNRELCAGFDARLAARVLVEAGWLKPGTDGRARPRSCVFPVWAQYACSYSTLAWSTTVLCSPKQYLAASTVLARR